MGRHTAVRPYSRTVRGRAVQVRRHTRTVAYGPRRRTGKGLFQLRRGWRHLQAQPMKRKNRRRWSKKKKMAFIALGAAEIGSWALMQTVGGLLSVLALMFSTASIAVATGLQGRMVKSSPRSTKKVTPK